MTSLIELCIFIRMFDKLYRAYYCEVQENIGTLS